MMGIQKRLGVMRPKKLGINILCLLSLISLCCARPPDAASIELESYRTLEEIEWLGQFTMQSTTGISAFDYITNIKHKMSFKQVVETCYCRNFAYQFIFDDPKYKAGTNIGKVQYKFHPNACLVMLRGSLYSVHLFYFLVRVSANVEKSSSGPVPVVVTGDEKSLFYFVNQLAAAPADLRTRRMKLGYVEYATSGGNFFHLYPETKKFSDRFRVLENSDGPDSFDKISRLLQFSRARKDSISVAATRSKSNFDFKTYFFTSLGIGDVAAHAKLREPVQEFWGNFIPKIPNPYGDYALRVTMGDNPTKTIAAPTALITTQDFALGCPLHEPWSYPESLTLWFYSFKAEADMVDPTKNPRPAFCPAGHEQFKGVSSTISMDVGMNEQLPLLFDGVPIHDREPSSITIGREIDFIFMINAVWETPSPYSVDSVDIFNAPKDYSICSCRFFRPGTDEYERIARTYFNLEYESARGQKLKPLSW